MSSKAACEGFDERDVSSYVSPILASIILCTLADARLPRRPVLIADLRTTLSMESPIESLLLTVLYNLSGVLLVGEFVRRILPYAAVGATGCGAAAGAAEGTRRRQDCSVVGARIHSCPKTQDPLARGYNRESLAVGFDFA